MEEMTIPHDLMAFQYEPFNGDKFIQMEMAKLAIKYPDAILFETGTCLASSTLFLAKHFPMVYTIEANRRYYAYSMQRVQEAEVSNINLLLGQSEELLPKLLFNLTLPTNVVFFLDAHWENFCPLLSELTAIAIAGIANPIITIHDWKVPGSTLGYDTYNGQDFTLEWIEPYLQKIYPSGFKYEYNSDEKSMGACRGIIYISSADPA